MTGGTSRGDALSNIMIMQATSCTASLWVEVGGGIQVTTTGVARLIGDVKSLSACNGRSNIRGTDIGRGAQIISVNISRPIADVEPIGGSCDWWRNVDISRFSNTRINRCALAIILPCVDANARVGAGTRNGSRSKRLLLPDVSIADGRSSTNVGVISGGRRVSATDVRIIVMTDGDAASTVVMACGRINGFIESIAEPPMMMFMKLPISTGVINMSGVRRQIMAGMMVRWMGLLFVRTMVMMNGSILDVLVSRKLTRQISSGVS